MNTSSLDHVGWAAVAGIVPRSNPEPLRAGHGSSHCCWCSGDPCDLPHDVASDPLPRCDNLAGNCNGPNCRMTLATQICSVGKSQDHLWLTC